ncbi:ArsR/SmtB family transcription factor [Actinomadura kijaniata]|uniref:ArsR/SmtB family transcription factor n=1 Tax=Actinomadura kijaniata TaxID=46161 RepID=UPI0008317DF1|nr:helix-turn-helix transcriptional regulator [Actinomadura kijaniata]
MRYRHPDRDQIRIDGVLSALGHPVRLAAVRVLDQGGRRNCGSVLEALGVTAKSTMTHHWRVLRESGVIRQEPSGRENLLTLRRDDLDARYPGLLDAALAGARTDEAEPSNAPFTSGGDARSTTGDGPRPQAGPGSTR